MQTITVTKQPCAILSKANEAFILFLILLLPLVIIAFQLQNSYPALGNFILFFSGWLCWTFIEYCNHRFRMHGIGDNSKVIGYKMHMVHHHNPTAIRITGLQRALLFSGNIGLISLCFLYKNWILLLAGVYTGFIIYTLMHWFLHRKISEKLFPEVHRFHIHHHCKHPDKCFGVTVTWWDHLFNTIPQQQKEITEKIKSFYYKE